MSYPKAEQFAEKMPLPMMACPDIKELYGYTHPILNEDKAIKVLCHCLGLRKSYPALEAAMDVLRERADSWA